MQLLNADCTYTNIDNVAPRGCWNRTGLIVSCKQIKSGFNCLCLLPAGCLQAYPGIQITRAIF